MSEDRVCPGCAATGEKLTVLEAEMQKLQVAVTNMLAEKQQLQLTLGHLATMSDTVLACSMYTAYCEAVGGKAHDGQPLPTWEEFSNDPSKVRQIAGWYAAVSVVRPKLIVNPQPIMG